MERFQESWLCLLFRQKSWIAQLNDYYEQDPDKKFFALLVFINLRLIKKPVSSKNSLSVECLSISNAGRLGLGKNKGVLDSFL